MIIDHRALWFAQTNTWVLAAERGGPAVLIDAPPDPEAVGELLRAHDLSLAGLVLTHGHVDHTGGAGRVVADTGATAYVHPDDDFLTLAPEIQLRALFGMTPPGDFTPPERYEPLADRQVLEVAGVGLEVMHTPGHTPGHCCLLLPDEQALFSGDQLFAGSIGRTDLPGGDYDTLMRSMVERVLPLADETVVYPGHGPVTTVGRERRSNPFLRDLPP